MGCCYCVQISVSRGTVVVLTVYDSYMTFSVVICGLHTCY